MKPSSQITWRVIPLVAALLCLTLVWALFGHQIQARVKLQLLLHSKNPSEEFFQEVASQYPNPVKFLGRAWNTGKIPHRQLVAAFLKDKADSNAPWFADAGLLLVQTTVDADASVRELGLAALEASRNPALIECARAQLADLDPLLRLQGLDYLRKADPRQALPYVVPLLDDSDLRVVAAAELALMHWSGEDYGVRARLAVVPSEGPHAGRVDPANEETIRLGVQRRKAWWRLHAKEFPLPLAGSASATPAFITRMRAPDFTLKDLAGKPHRLADYRGKVVLLNFWATWCTACLAEIPDLIALQNQMASEVAIIGVALDGAPDPQHLAQPSDDGDASTSGPSLSSARQKVTRAIKSRGINYTVLWDPYNAVGAQFNGGELPTTVFIDSHGRIVRRFIGERNLNVFRAMVKEAQSPAMISRGGGGGS